MNVSMRVCAGAVLLLMLGTTAHSQPWIQSWGAAPLPPNPPGASPVTPRFSNQTLRQRVRLSLGGGAIRIRFTNEHGTRPLEIGAARIAVLNDQGEVVPNTERPLLFDGQPRTLIPAGAPLLSDPVPLPVKPLASLSISLYLPRDTGPCTCHELGLETMQISGPGDFTAGPFTPKQTLSEHAFLSGVLVQGSARDHAVVVVGDSISDGYGSTAGKNRRWPDVLAQRLVQQGRSWAVVNMGISGNELLGEAAGQNALARFDRDVLGVPGAKAVIVLIGINDLGLSYGTRSPGEPEPKATQASMLNGYRQLIFRAHAAGLKVLGATLTPYGGAYYYSPEGEAIRQGINRWMRASHELDGVIDFDAMLRDPDKPTQIKAAFTGDHVHGNDAGYAAMGAGIDLALLN